MYLSIDQLRRLHFKPTVGFIRLSDGHEAKFNCSINIPDDRLEPTIIWMKNGQDLAANTHVVINELQTVASDRVTTLLSTVRYVLEMKCEHVAASHADRHGFLCWFQHEPRAEGWCWRVPLQTEHRLYEGRVPGDHPRAGRWVSAWCPLCSKCSKLFVHIPCGLGLPTFIQEPEDRNITRDTDFMLSCEAVGPPDPVKIRWLKDGSPFTDLLDSPSNYTMTGKTPAVHISFCSVTSPCFALIPPGCGWSHLMLESYLFLNQVGELKNDFHLKQTNLTFSTRRTSGLFTSFESLLIWVPFGWRPFVCEYKPLRQQR